jgi:hypothetical protein
VPDTAPVQVPPKLVLARVSWPGRDGKLSINAAAKLAGAALLLVKVMVSKVLPPDTIELGENTLAMLGGLMASKVSVVALGLLPLLVCKLPTGMVLTKLPPALALTSTLMTQVPGVPRAGAAGMSALGLSVTLLAPATAVTPVPPVQVVDAFGVAAMTRLLGKVSTSAALKLAGVKLLFDTVIVRVLVPPTAMVDGAKPLITVGALVVLVLRMAWALVPVAVTGVPPLVVVPVGKPVMLVKVVLAVLMVTRAVTVHEALGASALPATLMVSAPVMLRPVQVPPRVCTAGKKTMPAGNLSLRAKLV